MHELSITQNLLDIATRHAEKAGATRITDIHVVIGQLASVVDDSVQFYWDIISEGTLAAGASLHFERRPAQLRCRDCEHRYHPAQGELACPQCGSVQVEVLSGDEFYLESIEVDTAEMPQPDVHGEAQ